MKQRQIPDRQLPSICTSKLCKLAIKRFPSALQYPHTPVKHLHGQRQPIQRNLGCRTMLCMNTSLIVLRSFGQTEKNLLYTSVKHIQKNYPPPECPIRNCTTHTADHFSKQVQSRHRSRAHKPREGLFWTAKLRRKTSERDRLSGQAQS